MADEEFEIDIYGDANQEGDSKHEEADAQDYDDSRHDDENTHAYDSNPAIANGSNNHTSHQPTGNQDDEYNDHDGRDEGDMDAQESSSAQIFQQGTKRKEGSDDRPIDPGATNCLLVSDLNWWNTDDDIRSWVRQASCEDELKDITFSEHKVNGKSKGQAYLEFASQQAATATKHLVDSISSDAGQGGKKYTIIYSSPTVNPFKTLPKDAPARAKQDQSSRGGGNVGNYNDRGSGMGNNFGGGYRGRGGFNPRGGGYNRNFSGGNMGGGFNNNMGGGFNNNNNMGGNFGFNRGGGMMGGGMRGGPGMRGGRGGMNNGMMGGMGGMGGMPMGGMPGGMNMGMMGGGMPGFQGMQPHFNPAFFGQNQGGGGGGGGGEWQNPHGAKRPRGE